MLSQSTVIVCQKENEIRSFLVGNNRAERLFISRKTDFSIGDIVIGRVQKVKKDIDACFVELNKDIVGFLPLKDVNLKFVTNRNASEVKENDTIVVMISKEAVKTKPITLTCKLSIQGNYSVIHTDGNELTVSNKLSDDIKNELYKKISVLLPGTDFGYILRTNSANASVSEIISELKNNTEILSNVLSVMNTRTVFSKLYEAVPAFISQIRTINSDLYSKIITDNEELYKQLQTYIGNEKTAFYIDESLSMTALYSLEKHYSDATSHKINLKSGGYIIIDPCEALTVIDVNSGKAISKSKDSNIDIINTEAASEIARQLILRNISGIIIIDFINYTNRKKESDLINYFKSLLKDDPVQVKFIDITPLGLVEITRQKKYASIYDNIRK